MTVARCRCRECADGDALPDHLQGWPGAWQMQLLPPGQETPMLMPALDDWNYPRLREACAERCAEVGDPPCYEMNGQGPVDEPYCNKPCGECWRDVGVEPGDEFDEKAAVGRLL